MKKQTPEQRDRIDPASQKFIEKLCDADKAYVLEQQILANTQARQRLVQSLNLKKRKR